MPKFAQFFADFISFKVQQESQCGEWWFVWSRRLSSTSKRQTTVLDVFFVVVVFLIFIAVGIFFFLSTVALDGVELACRTEDVSGEGLPK